MSTSELQQDQTISNKQVFLRLFSQNGNISASAKKTGIHRRTVYLWLLNDPNFSTILRSTG
jgi:ActR/RegA family two-component response regulator